MNSCRDCTKKVNYSLSKDKRLACSNTSNERVYGQVKEPFCNRIEAYEELLHFTKKINDSKQWYAKDSNQTYLQRMKSAVLKPSPF